MITRLRVLSVMTGAVVIAVVTACAASGPANDGLGAPGPSTSATPTGGAATSPPASPSSGPTSPDAGGHPIPLSGIFVQKTGGIAGLRVFLTVAADGTWQYSEGDAQAKSGQQQTGQLTTAQVHELELRLADPRIWYEQRNPVKVGVCADTFIYTISFESAKWVLDDCYKSTNPGTFGVISFLSQNTPL